MKKLIVSLLFLFAFTLPVAAQDATATPTPASELAPVVVVDTVEPVIEDNDTLAENWEYLGAIAILFVGLFFALVEARVQAKISNAVGWLNESFVDPVGDYLGESVLDEIRDVVVLVARSVLDTLDLGSRDERIDYVIEMSENAFKTLNISAPDRSIIRGIVLEIEEELNSFEFA